MFSCWREDKGENDSTIIDGDSDEQSDNKILECISTLQKIAHGDTLLGESIATTKAMRLEAAATHCVGKTSA